MRRNNYGVVRDKECFNGSIAAVTGRAANSVLNGTRIFALLFFWIASHGMAFEWNFNKLIDVKCFFLSFSINVQINMIKFII